MSDSRRSSLLLFLWTVFFFSLFSAIPLTASRDPGAFFLGWFWRFLICAILVPAAAFAWRWIRTLPIWTVRAHRLSVRSFGWITFGALMLCSLPYFLAFFPGTIGADASPQLAQYAGDLPLTNHHPVFHTLLLGWLVDIGTTLTGSANGGAALYILFQVIFCNYSLMRCLLFLRRWQIPSWIVIGSGALTALSPYMQILMVYSTKDVPYAAALLLFVVYGCEFLFFSHPHRRIYSLAGMAVWGILMVLLRKQGIYMILLVLLIAVIVWRRRIREQKKIIWCSAQCFVIAVSFFLSSLLPSWMGVPEGNMREMLSVPAQQIAQTINESLNPETALLNPAQLETAWSYYEDYEPETYDRLSADPAKDQLITDGIRRNPFPFLKVWLTSVLADFSGAVFAWTDLIGPYFDMRLSSYYMGMNTLYSYTDYLNYRHISSSSLLPGLRAELANLTTIGTQRNLRWILFPFDFSLCLYLMIYALGYGWIRKKPAVVYGVSFGFVYFLTLLLGPVALSRYLFVLEFQIPLWLGLLYTAGFAKKASKNQDL